MNCLPKNVSNGETFHRLLPILHLAAFSYPVLLVGAFYGSWLAAWIVLGHPPRASLDDPSDALGLIYWCSGVVVALMPLGAYLGVCSMVARFVIGGDSRWTAFGLAVLNVGLWVGAIVLLRSDPIGVVNWWLD